VPWGHEFDFYLAIERIPIGLAVTLEFIGPLLVAVFGSKRFVDYLWVLLAAAGCFDRSVDK
jgi:inner membrane transporter RhtA